MRRFVMRRDLCAAELGALRIARDPSAMLCGRFRRPVRASSGKVIPQTHMNARSRPQRRFANDRICGRADRRP